MIGTRTRHSLAQFLELQEAAVCVVMLGKYGLQNLPFTSGQSLYSLLSALRAVEDRILLLVIAEIAATSGDLRARVNPKYRFDERIQDLTQCLILDGYIIKDKRLVQVDPSIRDAPPVEDDLIEALKVSGAPRALSIIERINASAEAFRSTPPDYNASLVNARVALETLASDIAADVSSRLSVAASDTPSKWGEVIAFLRNRGELAAEEERGLVGVFGFLSAGAHRPVGVSEDQMARLGRSFALNMCWFLLKNHLARK